VIRRVDLQRLTKDVRSIVGKNSDNDKMKAPVPAAVSAVASLKAGAGGRQPSINSGSQCEGVALSQPVSNSNDNCNRDDISRPSRLSQSPLPSALPSRAVGASLTVGTHSLHPSVRPSLLFSRTLASIPSSKQTGNDKDEAKDDDNSDFEEDEDEFRCGSEQALSRVR
jgi:hypothetical protein